MVEVRNALSDQSVTSLLTPDRRQATDGLPSNKAHISDSLVKSGEQHTIFVT